MCEAGWGPVGAADKKRSFLKAERLAKDGAQYPPDIPTPTRFCVYALFRAE